MFCARQFHISNNGTRIKRGESLKIKVGARSRPEKQPRPVIACPAAVKWHSLQANDASHTYLALASLQRRRNVCGGGPIGSLKYVNRSRAVDDGVRNYTTPLCWKEHRGTRTMERRGVFQRIGALFGMTRTNCSWTLHWNGRVFWFNYSRCFSSYCRSLVNVCRSLS